MVHIIEENEKNNNREPLELNFAKRLRIDTCPLRTIKGQEVAAIESKVFEQFNKLFSVVKSANNRRQNIWRELNKVISLSFFVINSKSKIKRSLFVLIERINYISVKIKISIGHS